MFTLPHLVSERRILYDGEAVYDPYKALKISPKATQEEVHNAFVALQRKYHPDKSKIGSSEWHAANDISSVINKAYSVIKTPYLRWKWHVAQDPEDTSAIAKMNCAKKQEALSEVLDMEFEYNQSLTEELSKGSQGLVIMKALYGTIAGEVDTALPLWNQRLGELIDVTIPVQAMVNGSHLVFSARDFSELCGFYDPVNKPRTLPRYLIVRYLNKGTYHQVVLQGGRPYTLPLMDGASEMKEQVLQEGCYKPEDIASGLMEQFPLDFAVFVTPPPAAILSPTLRKTKAAGANGSAAETQSPSRQILTAQPLNSPTAAMSTPTKASSSAVVSSLGGKVGGSRDRKSLGPRAALSGDDIACVSRGERGKAAVWSVPTRYMKKGKTGETPDISRIGTPFTHLREYIRRRRHPETYSNEYTQSLQRARQGRVAAVAAAARASIGTYDASGQGAMAGDDSDVDLDQELDLDMDDIDIDSDIENMFVNDVRGSGRSRQRSKKNKKDRVSMVLPIFEEAEADDDSLEGRHSTARHSGSTDELAQEVLSHDTGEEEFDDFEGSGDGVMAQGSAAAADGSHGLAVAAEEGEKAEEAAGAFKRFSPAHHVVAKDSGSTLVFTKASRAAAGQGNSGLILCYDTAGSGASRRKGSSRASIMAWWVWRKKWAIVVGIGAVGSAVYVMSKRGSGAQPRVLRGVWSSIRQYLARLMRSPKLLTSEGSDGVTEALSTAQPGRVSEGQTPVAASVAVTPFDVASLFYSRKRWQRQHYLE